MPNDDMSTRIRRDEDGAIPGEEVLKKYDLPSCTETNQYSVELLKLLKLRVRRTCQILNRPVNYICGKMSS